MVGGWGVGDGGRRGEVVCFRAPSVCKPKRKPRIARLPHVDGSFRTLPPPRDRRVGPRRYRGGFRCAPTGSFLAEDYENVSPVNKTQTVRMKFTFEYAPKTAMPDVRSMTATSCCDVTGDMKLTANVDFVNIEYDVPKCAEGTPPENCTHVATAVQPLDDMGAPESWVDLTYAVGHAHTGAILLELYDNVTGQLLCSSAPSYGNTSNAGDECVGAGAQQPPLAPRPAPCPRPVPGAPSPLWPPTWLPA